MKSVLLTGAAGFVGFHTAQRLMDAGWHVHGVDSFHPYYARELKDRNVTDLCGPRFQFEQLDLLTADLVERVATVDGVIHLAGVPGVRPSWTEFDDYVSANILTTHRIVDAIETTGCRAKLVAASSSSVYGDAEVYPTSVDTVPRPVSPYGVSKLAGENLISAHASMFNLNAVILRYFTVYGPRQRPDMAFQALLTSRINQGQFTLYGDGSQIRDFTFVADIARANVCALEANVAPGSIFNVASGEPVTMREVIDYASGRWPGLNVRQVQTAAGDVRRTGADIDATCRLLAWEPTTTWRAGLEQQMAQIQRTESVPIAI